MFVEAASDTKLTVAMIEGVAGLVGLVPAA
jgi:hypothetical protein